MEWRRGAFTLNPVKSHDRQTSKNHGPSKWNFFYIIMVKFECSTLFCDEETMGKMGKTVEKLWQSTGLKSHDVSKGACFHVVTAESF